MPHISITMYPGRSREIKESLARRMRDTLAEELGIDKSAVTVSVGDVGPQDWDASIEKIAPEEMIIGTKK